MKKCSNCKKTKNFSEFNKTKTNKDGLSYICKPCNLEVTRKYRVKNRDRYYQNQKEVRKTENHFISQTLYNAKTRANKKGFYFGLTSEQLKQKLQDCNYCCEITGLKMDFESHSRKKANPRKCSMDRIDSNKGYTIDNIQLVCWAVNQMKSDRTEEEFKFWVKTLYKAISSQASKEEGSTTIPQGSTLKRVEAPSP